VSGPAVFVDRLEQRRPRAGGHLAGLAEAPPQNPLRRFVVEQERALRVDQKDGRRQVAGQLSSQNDLNLFL
jgi:hypothetical protein